MTSEEKQIYPTVVERQEKQKELVIEQLKKTPIIQIVCEKVGISRATFYRWKQDDLAFADAIDRAIFMGVELINDMAESQLLAAIRDQNMTAIIFWLKHRHRGYGTRVELDANLKIERKLSPEEQAAVRKALSLAQLISPNNEEYETND
ncbi:MAG: phBC6A51 family helix-turn-helix protein [Candidatus Uhrbacteria bacterium]